jgi:hypothetical protein
MTRRQLRIRKPFWLEYRSWQSMKERCLNPNVKDYHRSGGRGITIDRRWMEFANFLEDMGPEPGPAYILDRIDNDGNYEIGNCRWATRQDQAINKRTTYRLTPTELDNILAAHSMGVRAMLAR